MNILKSFGICSLLAAFICCMATGCGQEKETGTKPPPAVAYTVDESLPQSGIDANDEQFYAKNVEKIESPLAGKKFYWLGSSVTYGAQSGGESMAEFLAAKTGCICKKDAVSGTTIFCDGKTSDTGEKSYTSRLKSSTIFDKNEKIDAFICQISTNDATNSRKKNWGEISADDKLYQEDFDLTTTLGGIEFIIAYVADTWDCPIYFYSGSQFLDKEKTLSPRANGDPSGSNYGELVDKVLEIAEKWQSAGVDVRVIDMFHDEAFNEAVTDAYYSWAVADPIHPRRAGYLQWWMPYFEQFLLVALELN